MRVHLLCDDWMDTFIFATASIQKTPEEETLQVVEQEGAHEGQADNHHNEDQTENDEADEKVFIQETEWYAKVGQSSNYDEEDS